jgi:hypothetical protein
MDLNDIKEKCKRQYWPERDEDLPEEYYMIQWLITEVERFKKVVDGLELEWYEKGQTDAAKRCTEIAQNEAYDDMSEYDLAVGHIVDAIRKEFGIEGSE